MYRYRNEPSADRADPHRLGGLGGLNEVRQVDYLYNALGQQVSRTVGSGPSAAVTLSVHDLAGNRIAEHDDTGAVKRCRRSQFDPKEKFDQIVALTRDGPSAKAATIWSRQAVCVALHHAQGWLQGPPRSR
jgi:hypothetical protein